MSKDLKSKAISIKGKKYILVKDRISYFNDNCKNGMIRTHLLSDSDAEMVVVKAQVIPDMAYQDRFFTGHSQAKWGDGMVNSSAALENAETSAVGRALAMMGIGIIDSVSSADEMVKAGATEEGIEDSAMCPIHKVKLTHYEQGNDEWWAHKTETGKWCNGRNTKYNKEK